MLVRSGIVLIKYWFSVSDAEQERRFQDRMTNPTKRWKISPMDLESRKHWADYSRAKDDMFNATDTEAGPLVRCQRRRQESRPAQRNPPSAFQDSLQGSDSRGAGTAPAGEVGVRPPALPGAALHPSDLPVGPRRTGIFPPAKENLFSRKGWDAMLRTFDCRTSQK